MITVTKQMIDIGVVAYREWEDKNILPFELTIAANGLAVERLVADILWRVLNGNLIVEKEVLKILDERED